MLIPTPQVSNATGVVSGASIHHQYSIREIPAETPTPSESPICEVVAEAATPNKMAVIYSLGTVHAVPSVCLQSGGHVARMKSMGVVGKIGLDEVGCVLLEEESWIFP